MNHPPPETAIALVTTEAPPFDQRLSNVLTDVAGQLAPRSRRIYSNDMRHFAEWLATRGLSLDTLTRSAFIEYRQHLADSYAKATAARMLVVARRILDEAVLRGDLTTNPASEVRGFKSGTNETPHTALTKAQARELLGAIEVETAMGQRDYALILLLIRTGIRRSEAAALQLGDLGLEQGHKVATIRHGKGDKRRLVKLPVDVYRAITRYLETSGRSQAAPDAPLFVRFRKGSKANGGLSVATEEALTDKGIELIVKGHAKAVGIEGLTPHGLRASFVTLALEGGASLHQVQYAAGHADPRTTERYQKRKLNLDDNGVDYIRI